MHSIHVKTLATSLVALLALAACGDDTSTTTSSSSSGGGEDGGDGGSTAGPTTTSTGSTTTTTTTTAGPTTTSTGSGDGGAGQGGSGDGGAGQGGSGDGGAGQGGAGQGGAGGSTSSGVDCSVETFFADPACDACALDQCCTQIELCEANPADCADAEGFLDPESTYGGPLIECLGAECLEECGSSDDAQICDSGVFYPDDPTVAQCLGAECCDEFNTCTMNGADPQGCVDCFNAGGGAQCDAAVTCADDSTCFGDDTVCLPDEFRCDDGQCIPGLQRCNGGVPQCADDSDEIGCVIICDSNIGYIDDNGQFDPALNTCVSNACCDEFMACSDDGVNADACLACLEAGGGQRCNAAIACSNTSGCFEGICNTSLQSEDSTYDACLDDNCCSEFAACYGNATPAEVALCNQCLEDGGGPLCDPLIQCIDDNGC